MATVKILNSVAGLVRKIYQNTYSASFVDKQPIVKITNSEPIVKTIKQKDFALIKISNDDIQIRIKNDLQFRVKFSNIQIPGYGPGNVPPIGIAIIGVNNYIL